MFVTLIFYDDSLCQLLSPIQHHYYTQTHPVLGVNKFSLACFRATKIAVILDLRVAMRLVGQVSSPNRIAQIFSTVILWCFKVVTVLQMICPWPRRRFFYYYYYFFLGATSGQLGCRMFFFVLPKPRTTHVPENGQKNSWLDFGCIQQSIHHESPDQRVFKITLSVTNDAMSLCQTYAPQSAEKLP